MAGSWWQLSPESGRSLGDPPAQVALDGLVYVCSPSRMNRSLFYSQACPGLDKELHSYSINAHKPQSHPMKAKAPRQGHRILLLLNPSKAHRRWPVGGLEPSQRHGNRSGPLEQNDLPNSQNDYCVFKLIKFLGISSLAFNLFFRVSFLGFALFCSVMDRSCRSKWLRARESWLKGFWKNH